MISRRQSVETIISEKPDHPALHSKEEFEELLSCQVCFCKA